MRITGPSGPAQTAQTNRSAPASSGNGAEFARHLTGDAPSTQASAGTTAAKAPPSLDALIALQGISEDPREKRRKAARNGRQALDILEELRLGLLSGQLDPAMMLRLTSALAQLGERSGEEGLDSVLDAIETRAAVELAKIQQAQNLKRSA